MDGGRRDRAPEGDPLPWGPPFQVFLAQLWARTGEGHPQGERGSRLKPELEVVLAGPGIGGPWASPAVKNRAPTVRLVLMSRGVAPICSVKKMQNLGL